MRSIINVSVDLRVDPSPMPKGPHDGQSRDRQSTSFEVGLVFIMPLSI